MVFMLVASISYSNGGCIKITDDTFVQMSHAPHTPKVNEKTSFLFSFADKNGLVSKEISGKLRIMKGEEPILAKKFEINDGILDLKHEFKEGGIHEIFVDFTLENKTYSTEEFVIEVIKDGNINYLNYLIFLIAGILIGFLSSKLMTKKK